MTSKILLVEDNSNTRLVIRQVLEATGYTVVEATDGLQGIQMAREEQPDLILMDINIPGLDGYETTIRLKSMPETSRTPIVALTGKVTPGSRERALAAGCDGYLTKPVKAVALPEQVARFLGGFRETLTLNEENTYLREHTRRLVQRLEQKVQEFTEANQALAHTDAMKSRFIQLAAHELRTPLAGLHGYLSMLTTAGNTLINHADPHTQEIISGINTCVDRLQGIVQDMLDITRIETGTLQLKYAPVSLEFIFDKIKKEFQEVAEARHQTLTIANAQHLPMLWVDGERVTQILRNLASNAIKYTPDGGTIKITAETIDDNALANPAASGDKQFVKITVSDTGIGVNPDHHEAIFQSFYEIRDIELHSTSKTGFMGSGAGLGLPIARGVAEAHGGALWVESDACDPEQCPGSTFHLILPVGNPPES